MKKFTKVLEGKELGYTDFFGNKVSPEKDFIKMLKSGITHIMMEEGEISEKAFKEIDEVIEQVDKLITKELVQEAMDMHRQDKRIKLICEFIYDKYIN
jgi:hypothetical protein